MSPSLISMRGSASVLETGIYLPPQYSLIRLKIRNRLGRPSAQPARSAVSMVMAPFTARETQVHMWLLAAFCVSLKKTSR